MERRPTPVSAKTSARDAHGLPITGRQSVIDSAPLGAETPLVLHNLQNDLAALAQLLPAEIERKSWLDAYLVSAGMNQIVEDHLHPEIYPLDRAAEYLAVEARPLARIAGRVVAGLAVSGRAIAERRPATRRIRQVQRELGKLVDGLAAAVAGGASTGEERSSMLESCSAVIRAVDDLPSRLRRDVIRLPACFQSFDQRPADQARLAEAFSSRWPRRSRPLLVVGVRTSGNYLAPLCAAFLKSIGYQRVQVLTVRPERGLLEHERALARSIAREGGLALVVDDPPVTGSGIATSVRRLETAGFRAESVVLLLQVFGAGVPSALDRHPAVVLPWEGWAVNARLVPEAVERELSGLVGPGVSVLGVEPVSAARPRSARGHCRALFRVRLRERESDHEEHVVVEGVGLGYFGAQALAVPGALETLAPRLLGLRDGLLYREWLPDERRIGSLDPNTAKSVAGAIASYVSERHRALPVEEDVSLRVVGRYAAWEVASTILSRPFGRAWPLAKVLVMDRVVKRLLRTERPSVVDGGTDLDHWFFHDDSKRSVAKVSSAEGAFSHLGLSCFDPAFDLAGATASALEPSFVRGVREAYARLGNPPVDEERWLLYELAHLWRRKRKHPEEEAELNRACSRVVQRYLAEVYLRDVEASFAGPLCALDVDGVIETGHLGFPSMTPAAARALRALILHGYRPVLASGRSLDEIAERCHVYGLVGGVAEYGAAYVTVEGRAGTLLPDEAVASLARLRSALSKTEGVHVDEDYRLAVRAFRIDGRSSRRGLLPETISACLAQVEDGQVRAIPGDAQTDFMVRYVDKATGLRTLVDHLDWREPAPGGKAFALTVGDTVSDIPCAALAMLACAPAHADPRLRLAGFEIMRAPYQAGLAEAVGRLLGHRAGGCRVCRTPPFTRERKLLLAALAAQERGRRSMATQAVKLAIGRG
jgi:trehalose-6-phosphatase